MRRGPLPSPPYHKGSGRALRRSWPGYEHRFGCPRDGRACRFAQSVHRPDAGAAGARENRRTVATGARSLAVLCRAAGGAPSHGARFRRGGAAAAPGPGPGGTVWRADHSWLLLEQERVPVLRIACRTISPASAQRRACWRATLGGAAARRGPARRDGRQAGRAAAPRPRRSAPWSGNHAALQRDPAR